MIVLDRKGMQLLILAAVTAVALMLVLPGLVMRAGSAAGSGESRAFRRAPQQNLEEVAASGYAGGTIHAGDYKFYCQQSGNRLNAAFDKRSHSLSRFVTACPQDVPSLIQVLRELLREKDPYRSFVSHKREILRWIAFLGG